METLTHEVTKQGLQLTSEELERLGWREGQQVQVQFTGRSIVISPVLSPADKIRARALSHLFQHVGDATAVGLAEWIEDRWRVEVFLSYKDAKLGHLVFDPDGNLIEEESSSREQMLEAALAA